MLSFKKSVPIEDHTRYNWAEQRNPIKYNDIINFERAGIRGEHHCVMCGLVKGNQCEIPNQNKDVCKRCDCSYWKILEGEIIVKFCKGCKKFSLLSDFAEKPEASKCAKCRERGRQNYHTRRQNTAETQKTKRKLNAKDTTLLDTRTENLCHSIPSFPTNGSVPYHHPYSVSMSPLMLLPHIPQPQSQTNPSSSSTSSSPSNDNSSQRAPSYSATAASRGLMRRDSSPDQGMYTSQPSLSSSSHDSHSISSRHRHSDLSTDSSMSSGLFDQQFHPSRSQSSTGRRSSASSTNFSPRFLDTSSLLQGRSSSSTFASPHPLSYDVDPSIILPSDHDGFYHSTSGDSGGGGDVVSSSLSTIDTQNTSIDSVDLSDMMRNAIPNTPCETFYSLPSTSFTSFNVEGGIMAPTPLPNKKLSTQPQLSRQTSTGGGTGSSQLRHIPHGKPLVIPSNHSQRQHHHPAGPTITVPSLNTPSAFSFNCLASPDSYLGNGNGMGLGISIPMTPLSPLGPDGDGDGLMHSPSLNLSGSSDYRWDPHVTPLENLATVSESYKINERTAVVNNGSSSSSSNGSPLITSLESSQQRVTRSQSSKQQLQQQLQHQEEEKEMTLSIRKPRRRSPRSPRPPSQSSIGSPDGCLSPVGMSSPKYLASPELPMQPQQREKRRGQQRQRERVQIFHDSQGMEEIKDEIDCSNISNAMTSSLCFNTTTESPDDKLLLLPLSLSQQQSLPVPLPQEEQEQHQQHQQQQDSFCKEAIHSDFLSSSQSQSQALSQGQGQRQVSGQGTAAYHHLNKRKRRRDTGDEEDDNILRVAIADPSHLRSLSPVNIPS